MPGVTISAGYGAGGSVIAPGRGRTARPAAARSRDQHRVAAQLQVSVQEAEAGAIRRSLVDRFFALLAPLAGGVLGAGTDCRPAGRRSRRRTRRPSSASRPRRSCVEALQRRRGHPRPRRGPPPSGQAGRAAGPAVRPARRPDRAGSQDRACRCRKQPGSACPRSTTPARTTSGGSTAPTSTIRTCSAAAGQHRAAAGRLRRSHRGRLHGTQQPLTPARLDPARHHRRSCRPIACGHSASSARCRRLPASRCQ